MSEFRAWHFHVDDMINFAQKALEYSEGLGQEGFDQIGLLKVESTTMLRFAIWKND